ncbi:MAG: glutathione peroxidase [Bacteroidia bacterium]|nr:glutathione peroxidase [Bacteroidia bacterium]
MKKYIFSIMALAFTGLLVYSFTESKIQQPKIMAESTNFYDYSLKSLDGSKTLSMADFKGKYVLCVNVASECGYTKQYEGLQKLQDLYKEKLVIVGFPCNQFGGQEPGTAEEIGAFCKKNYGVCFPLTEKIEVKGSGQHPIYQWLCKQDLNGKASNTVKWNFNKFLVGPDGNWIAYFPSGTEPMSAEITNLIK